MREIVVIADTHYHDREPSARVLSSLGFEVMTAVGIEEIQRLSKEAHPTTLFLDKSIPGAFEQLPQLSQTLRVVVTGQRFEWQEARDALQGGAFDVLEKPLTEERLLTLFKTVQEHLPKREKKKRKRATPTLQCSTRKIIGEEPAFLAVLEMVKMVADTESTVLVTGETGTGKEVIARHLHETSNRSRGPFIPVNCGAIPDNLLESELFGHVKGAFTGAVTDKMGVFGAAEGGTVFLDEIGEMSQNLQVKLLRVLQEKEYTPVGDYLPKKANVRIVAATNLDLVAAIKEKSFREDLYYRLNVIPIDLPPLRARPYDILLLFDHFRQKFNRATGRDLEGISDASASLLMGYTWPGNIRELENLVERLVILKRTGVLEPHDFPLFMHTNSPPTGGAASFPQFTVSEEGVNLKETLESIENNIIVQALNMTSGNKNRAASLLSMNRTTLVEKLRKKKHLLDQINSGK